MSKSIKKNKNPFTYSTKLNHEYEVREESKVKVYKLNESEIKAYVTSFENDMSVEKRNEMLRGKRCKRIK